MIYKKVLQSEMLSLFTQISHGFTTKYSSPARFNSLNYFTFPKQIHSNKINWKSRQEKNNVNEGDGILTNERDFPIAIHTADCLPMLFYEPDKNLIAAVHAGWKGTVAKIAEQAIATMRQRGGHVQNLYVVLGPCIEFDCYDIPQERAAQIKNSLGDDIKFLKRKKNTYFFNLRYANYKQLVDLGVAPSHIEINDWCTYCNDWLFSRRRDKGSEKGQNISYIGLN